MASARNVALGLITAALVGGAGAGAANASLWSLLTDAADQATPQSADPPTVDSTGKSAVIAAGHGLAYKDGSFTGQTFDAYYGAVQVQANVTGGHIVSVDVLKFPNDRRTSRYINSQALPMLKSEVISAQTTQVDIISGATLTSQAFIRSLRTALKQAAPGT